MIQGLVVAGVAAMLSAAVYGGKLDPRVSRRLRGRLIVTNAELSTSGLKYKEALKAIKKANLTELKAVRKEAGVSYYAFHWSAFMTRKPGTTTLALEFYKVTDPKSMNASKGLTGVDPRVTILQGRTEISEDDGVTTGKQYWVKLVATINGRDYTLAKTKLTFK